MMNQGTPEEKNDLEIKEVAENNAEANLPVQTGEFDDDLSDEEDALAIPSEIANLLKDSEEFQLTQDLKGFASCFPKWDLYPPKK